MEVSDGKEGKAVAEDQVEEGEVAQAPPEQEQASAGRQGRQARSHAEEGAVDGEESDQDCDQGQRAEEGAGTSVQARRLGHREERSTGRRGSGRCGRRRERARGSQGSQDAQGQEGQGQEREESRVGTDHSDSAVRVTESGKSSCSQGRELFQSLPLFAPNENNEN